MKLNEQIYKDGLVKYSLENGGRIRPLYFNLPKEDGVAMMNPSIINLDGTLMVNIRCTNYTLWHSLTLRWPHTYGPLEYIHPEHLRVLATVNYLGILNKDTLDLEYVHKVDMRLDKNPIWTFWGLEDVRLVNWDSKLFMTGVRRDTTPDGQGRMELSEINWNNGYPFEISRQRIPAPGKDDSYCEKNWMPIIDKEYTYIKWTSPTEVAKYDPINKITTSDIINPKYPLREVRGGSQLIPYKDKYIATGHTVEFRNLSWGEKDARYHSQLMIWDKSLQLEYISDDFKFMNSGIEFSNGICEYGDSFLISFACEDNAAYVVEINKNKLFTE